ncbi:MAG: hypothetical protein A4S09_04655 [Proteobacteria bacterium SG_bin7]|nr:MAG: hypothetical protein A4S09_04655 [Proteobacteria bacterium SG_bin7]
MSTSVHDQGQDRSFHVAILAASPGDLQPIVRYLEKRTWVVKTFDAFNELAKYLIENNPDYVLLSFSIQLPEITKYPQIIWNKFKIPVIPFGESTDNHTVGLLRAFGHDALLPPISGPLVYSKIAGHATGGYQTKLHMHSATETAQPIGVKSHKTPSQRDLLNLNRIYKEEERQFFGQLENSLSAACDARNSVDTPVAKTKKLTVLPIADGMFTGMLVFVMGDEDSVDPMLINNMREKLGSLNTFIKFDGIMTKSLSIEIDEVDFNIWTSHKARFVSRAEHRGKEVMMAFFEMDKKLVEIAPSIDPKMAKINVESITPNVAIDFDAYLYLQSNQKFLKYLHSGTRVSPTQLQNLKEREIDSFHIDKEDQSTYHAYVAKNYLSSTISSGQSYLTKPEGNEEE